MGRLLSVCIRDEKIMTSTVIRQLKDHNRHRSSLMKNTTSIEALKVKSSDNNQYMVELINKIEETKKTVTLSIEETNRIIRTLVLDFVK